MMNERLLQSLLVPALIIVGIAFPFIALAEHRATMVPGTWSILFTAVGVLSGMCLEWTFLRIPSVETEGHSLPHSMGRVEEAVLLGEAFKLLATKRSLSPAEEDYLHDYQDQMWREMSEEERDDFSQRWGRLESRPQDGSS